MKKIVCGILATTMVMGVGASLSSVSAAEHSAVETSRSQQGIISQELIQTVDSYVKLSNNQFLLTDEESLKERLSESEFKQVQESITLANQEINKVKNDIKYVEGNTVVVEGVQENAAFSLASSNEGINDLRFHWWGYEIFLSKSTMQKLVSVGIAAGGGYIGYLVKKIGEAVLAAVIAETIKEFGKDYIPAVRVEVPFLTGRPMVYLQ